VLADPAPRPAERKREIRAFLRAAMLRHPADPYFPLVGATIAWQERDQNAIPWLQRVLERSLVNGKAHLLLAQVLAAVPVRHQALLELRLAVENDPTLIGYAARMALAWAMTFDELLMTVPSEERAGKKARALSLETLGASATDREAVGARCDALALELDPTLPGPHERLAKDLVGKLGKPELCPDEAKCEHDLEQHLTAIEATHPSRSSVARLRAERLAALGMADEAEKLLAAECERFDDHQVCLQDRAKMASQIPDVERLTAAGKALLTAVCMEQERCAESATWLGDLHSGRKEWGAAVNFYRQAIRDGENVDRHVKLAQAASQAGMHAQASRSLERALEMKGEPDAELQRRLAEEKEKATAPLLGK
jgi:tetratricopeptide (TPR) repeat protein